MALCPIDVIANSIPFVGEGRTDEKIDCILLDQLACFRQRGIRIARGILHDHRDLATPCRGVDSLEKKRKTTERILAA